MTLSVLTTMGGLKSAWGQTPSYSLPAAPMEVALKTLARLSGRNILFPPTGGLQSRAVVRARSVTEALDKILEGTPLRYVVERDNSITIVPASPVKAGRPRQRARVAPQPLADTPETEIVVTALRRDQPLIDVPAAIVVVTEDRARRLGVRELDRLSRFTPGLVVEATSPATASFGIRGITQNSGDSTREPRISVFQDGMSISSARGAYVELFDVERIEVVKGPQSTLYGRAAMTGAINIVQNKASLDELAWRGEAEVGRGGYRLAEAMVNLPVGKVAIRGATRAKSIDGYADNLAGGSPLAASGTLAGRIAARWEPSAGSTVDLIANVEHDRTSGTPYKSLRYLPTDPASGRALGDLRPASPLAATTKDDAMSPDGLGLDRNIGSVALLVDIDLGQGFRLSSTTAFRRFHGVNVSDQDGTALPFYDYAEDTRGRLISHETRVSLSNAKGFAAFAGFSFSRETGSQNSLNRFDERLMAGQVAGMIAAPQPQPTSVLLGPAFTADALKLIAGRRGVALSDQAADRVAAALSPAYFERNVNTSGTTSIDAFADTSWSPFAKFELSAGIRYSRDNKRSTISAAPLNTASVLGGFLQSLSMSAADRETFLAAPAAARAGLLVQPTSNIGGTPAQRLIDSGWSWRAVARYKPNARISVYAYYARGRRPMVLVGGGPLTPYGVARFSRVPAETVDSMEGGGEFRSADGRIKAAAAVYRYQYRNFQTTVFDGDALRTTNAGRADAYGAEAQVEWLIGSGLNLFASYSYNHARFVSGAYKGNSFRLAPDHRFAIGGLIERRVAGGTVSLSPSYAWQSRIFFNDDNDRPGLGLGLVPDTIQDELQKSYGLLDLRLGYAPVAANWRLTAFVTNLLDKRYVRDAGVLADGLGLPSLAAAPPRTFGFNLSIQNKRNP